MHFYGVLLGQFSNTELHTRDTSDGLYLKLQGFCHCSPELVSNQTQFVSHISTRAHEQTHMDISYQGTGYVTSMDSGFLREFIN